ncbi:hypothetical protein [Prolixibacter sp. NT017]|uniref:hypothetical protein n=1 Tax=Prolixibacter sp. NT017 TaxID=2652390 RepID=UPI001275735C|nr:hypothetical protein [Prolixibacter sp. NT017]GET26005.1 hypothetical protein NT017_23340 [Prolixibacter sp. NT017]
MAERYRKYIVANNPLICRFNTSGFKKRLNIFILTNKNRKMRKLILEMQMSVDGFVAEVDGNTDWMLWNWGPD